MTDTVKQIMSLVEAYRTAGGREEHWARKDVLEAELTRLFTYLGEADVWHEGTSSYYRAKLIRKIHPEEIYGIGGGL